jgi:hypothetical protein
MPSLWSNLAAVWSLLLLLAVIGTLLWFLYSFFLRRIIRARRIANAHLKRILREAAERESGGE